MRKLDAFLLAGACLCSALLVLLALIALVEVAEQGL